MEWGQNPHGALEFQGLAYTAKGWNEGFDPVMFDEPAPDAPDNNVSLLTGYIFDDIVAQIESETLEIEDVNDELIRTRANYLIEAKFDPPAHGGLRKLLYTNSPDSLLGQVRALLERRFPDPAYVPVGAQSPPRRDVYTLVQGNQSPVQLQPFLLEPEYRHHYGMGGTIVGMGPRLGGPEGPPP